MHLNPANPEPRTLRLKPFRYLSSYERRNPAHYPVNVASAFSTWSMSASVWAALI